MNGVKTMGFSFDSIGNFDEHIEKSIPNYDLLFKSILRISDYFREDGTRIYDLGCSTGKLLKAIGFNGEKFGIDNCPNLLPETTPEINFCEFDLNKDIDISNACIVYAIFTLQFLKRNIRQSLLKRIYGGLNKGGASIMAEKVYAEDAVFQDIFTFSYYDYKKNSFSPKEILDKEEDLRKILRPNTSAENEAMLRAVGFHNKHLFYKYFNFEAFLCVK